MHSEVSNIMTWVIDETKRRGLGKYKDLKSVNKYAEENGVSVKVVEETPNSLYSTLVEANKKVIESKTSELHPNVNFGGTIDVLADIMSLRMITPEDTHNKLMELCRAGKDIESEIIKMSRKTGIRYKDLMRYHTHMTLLDALGITA